MNTRRQSCTQGVARGRFSGETAMHLYNDRSNCLKSLRYISYHTYIRFRFAGEHDFFGTVVTVSPLLLFSALLAKESSSPVSRSLSLTVHKSLRTTEMRECSPSYDQGRAHLMHPSCNRSRFVSHTHERIDRSLFVVSEMPYIRSYLPQRTSFLSSGASSSLYYDIA